MVIMFSESENYECAIYMNGFRFVLTGEIDTKLNFQRWCPQEACQTYYYSACFIQSKNFS